MSIQVQPEVGQLVALAHNGGVETTLESMAAILDLAGADILTVALEVQKFVATFQLELEPSLDQGTILSGRVLRHATDVSTVVARVNRIRDEGESQSIEFKSSLFCSMREWSQSGTLVDVPSLPGEVLKTICAFLNGSGGQLLIGINDDGEACEGIALDMKLKGWNFDKWQLHLLSLIRGRFFEGAAILPYVEMVATQIDSRLVVLVNVVAREARSFVRRENNKPFEFFIRKGPSTESLDLPTFNAHLRALRVSDQTK